MKKLLQFSSFIPCFKYLYLLLLAFTFSNAEAQVLPDATQDFTGYSNLNDGTNRLGSPDGFFILSSSNNANLDADDYGAFLVAGGDGATGYLEVQINPDSELGSFELVELFVGEYGSGVNADFENNTITAYSGEDIVAEATPYNSVGDGVIENYPIDYSTFSGKRIDRLRISFTALSGTNFAAYNLVSFTIANSSTGAPAPSFSLPTVSTSSVSSITTTGATLSGNLTNDGGDPVTERGFVYATDSGPTTSDTKVQDGDGTGIFEEAITGLSASTTYYVRAYAINGQGTSYGSEESFTTLAPPTLTGAITITNDPSDPASDWSLSGGKLIPFVDGAKVNVSEIINALDSGDLTIEAETDVFIDATVTPALAAARSLTLQAGENVILSPGSEITATGDKLNLVFWSDADGNEDGMIWLRESASITTNGGHLWMGGGDGTATWNGLTVGDGFAQAKQLLPSTELLQVNNHNYSHQNGITLDKTSLTTDDGDLTLRGKVSGISTAESTGYGQIGVYINQGNTITTTSGKIQISGITEANKATQSWFYGILLASDREEEPNIIQSESGMITLEGSASQSHDGNYSAGIGIFEWTLGINEIRSVSGDINIYGHNKNTTNASLGAIAAIGGGAASKRIYSQSGNIHLLGKSDNPNAVGLNLGGDIRVGSDGNLPYEGAITLEADIISSFNVDSRFSSSGSLSIKPITSSTTIGIGGASGTLQLPASYFSTNFANGFSEVVVGDENSGLITVENSIAYLDPLTIKTNGSIVFTDGADVSSTAANALTLWSRASGNNEADDAVSGTIWMPKGSSINTGGGDLTMGGGSDPNVGYAKGDNSAPTGENYARSRGVAMNGAVNAAGGNIIINGRASNDVTHARGVNIAGPVITKEDGNITVRGIAVGASDAIALGDSWFTPSAVGTLETETGDISLDGKPDGSTRNGLNISTSGSNIKTSGNFSANTTGRLTATAGALDIGGNTILEAVDNITFTHVDNDFDGNITVNGAANLQVTDQNELTLGEISVSGTIDIATLGGDLTITENISTTNATAAAIQIFADKNKNAGDPSGGNIKISSITDISTGAGGQARFYSGSTLESADLITLTGEENTRYEVDSGTTVFEPVLGSGNYALIREEYIPLSSPTVSTSETIANITAGTADVSGSVTDNGNLEIEKQGFVWFPNDNPTDTTIIWAGGTFETTLSNLPPYTEIGIKAIAVNAAGTSEGGKVTFTTQKAELTVGGSFTIQNKVYDGGTSATIDQDNLTLSGVYTGHDVQIAVTELEFWDKNAATGITVTIDSLSLSGSDVDKYNLSLTGAPTAAADITPRPITLTADAATVVYGETDPTFSYQITSGSLPQDDAITGMLSHEAGNDAGTYKILQGDVTAGSNFNLTFVSADFTITPKTLTVQADAGQGKAYGAADPTLTYSATGFEYSDDESVFTGSLSRVSGEAAGTYAINQGSLDAGSNYTIEFTSADFTITDKELLITVDEGLSKIYGEADPALTISASGFEEGDDETVITGSLSRESGENVGQYAITAGTISAGDNYAITIHSDSLYITPKSLTVTAEAGQTKVYGETDPVFAYSASGFVLGDDETLFSGSLSRAEGEDTGSYAITHGNLSAGANYMIDFNSSDFTITPATLVVEAEAGQTKVEGEEDPEFSYTASGFVWNDELSVVTGQLSREQGEIPGSYALQLGSLKAPNYDIDFTSVDFTILRTPPVAEQLQPAKRAGKVPVDTVLFARFDQPINLTGSGQVRLQSSTGDEQAIQWSSNEDSLVITPEIPLAHFEHYILTIDAGTVQNQDEVSNAEISWEFVTEMDVPAVRFPADAAMNISTAPNLEWNSTAENANTHVQFADNAALSSPALDLQINRNDYQLNNLQAHQNYYWRVRTVDTLQGIATGSEWSLVHQFTTRTDPVVEESDPVAVTFDFGGTSGGSEGNGEQGAVEKTEPEQTDYRMVGLPGTDNTRLNEFFEGSYKKNWRAFIETGDDLEFYDEYEEGDKRFAFRPGLGFWVLSTEIVTADMEFTAVETNANDSYGFPVHPGWNIISNPYQSAVEWAVVEAFNDMESPLYGYNQRFMQVDTLKPFQGYYYYNDPARNQDSLFIPYTGFDQRTSDKPAGKDLSPLKDAGTISLNAVFHDSSTTNLEMLFGSRQKLSSFRRPYPNLQFARAGAVLANEEESRLRYQRTFSSARPEDETYLMEVKAPVGSSTTWSLELQEMSERTGALLVNKVTNQPFLLEQEKKRKIKHSEPLSRYDVFVGDINYLKEMQEKLLPQEFELSQNYPNPFNPATNIRYALPERAEVRLEVYDILGRKVHTLVNQQQQAGWHMVNWDASALSSGMYLYRLTAGDNVSVKKLTLIK